MGKKKPEVNEELLNQIQENISVEPLEEVMGDRYATYAKYVIQDRAIPDVRDGMKPVQRRIIFSMYKSGNTFNKPTKKCAHTVGAVMGTYHPHGDSSIYEALARMSQDWKVRYPLIDFQGNNGSIDGDSPAAYRYTESRLSELSNELIKDIEKDTVEMQLNFDDTELEPTVLPSRFPNLLVNGTEGIAVALATEIPPHNLREVIDAIIYRIGHKTATTEDLRQFVLGPDFPGGGFIYQSSGLDNIYLTGRGRIEVASKAEFVTNKDNQQIIITELPYKAVKINTVYEIDKIRHSKAIDGILEVRDESDYKGIRIVVDCKKEAKVDLIWNYLLNKTSLQTGYSANMVAIVDGRPRTLSLLEFVDAYIAHQVDVVTRKSKFDLNKCENRLHIVDGLITASLNINEVVEIIRRSKDKADSKVNLIAKYGFSNEQAEAIVTMPLYKLSHTDEEILFKEKKDLETTIEDLKGIIEDPNKLNRVLVKDLKAISSKYGDERRTQIIEKGETKPIDKRELIAREDVMVSITYDGYIKRSSIKSYKSSESLPGVKDSDALIHYGLANTIDYLVCFTNKGNYIVVPVHKLTENRWKDEGTHINDFTTLGQGEKLIKAFVIKELRNDLYIGMLSKLGQIKRFPLSDIDVSKKSRPQRAMKILNSDSIVGVELLSGNSNLLVITNNGFASYYNENELSVVSAKAGGVKAMGNMLGGQAACLLAFEESERGKVALFTDKGHVRVFDAYKLPLTNRLGKASIVCQSFKNDVHKVVSAVKIGRADLLKVNLHLSNLSSMIYEMNDFHVTEAQNAKKNISTPAKTLILRALNYEELIIIDKNVISHPIIAKEPRIKKPIETSELIDTNDEVEQLVDVENEPIIQEEKPVNSEPEHIETEPKKEEHKETIEQMSIFDDIDE